MMKLIERSAALILSFALAICISSGALAQEAAAQETAPRYYDQLNANQREVYDRLAALDGPEDAGEITIRLPEPIVYKADASGENRKADSEFRKIGQGALDALLMDDPSILWIDKDQCSSMSGARAAGEADEFAEYTWKIDRLTISVAAEKDGAFQLSRMREALFDAEGETRYEKVRDIHDRLCALITYEANDHARSPYGALVEGRAVCEGYAKAFKILCDRAGIPSVIVAGHGVTRMTGPEGENHMWNYVRMEDGQWYAVDVTWDDQKDQICRDFFLVGSSTVSTPAFGSASFESSHIPNGDFSRSGVVFDYPPLSDGRYVPA